MKKFPSSMGLANVKFLKLLDVKMNSVEPPVYTKLHWSYLQ